VELDDGSTYQTRIVAGSNTETYTLAMPVAAPASNGLFQVTSGGVGSFETSPSVTGLTITDADIDHGNRVLHISASNYGAADWGTATSYGGYVLSGAVGIDVFIPINLLTGDRIVSATLYIKGYDTASKTFKLYKTYAADGTDSQLGSTASSTSATFTSVTVDLSGGSEETVTTEYQYWGVFRAASAYDITYHCQVTYDRV
jgi:hypothetical protein